MICSKAFTLPEMLTDASREAMILLQGLLLCDEPSPNLSPQEWS
jgi:hypothetical protein